MVGDLDWFASETDSPERAELENLAARLSQHMDLPKDMQIRMHYSADGTVNALATLGGNVVFFKGLTDLVQSEDELAMVMAHEIAHVKLRHPIVAAGKGVTLASFAAVLTGVSGSTAGQWLIGSTTNLSMMSFSRDQESDADALAAAAIVQEYGHLQGAQDLFQRFSELEGDSLGKQIEIEAFNSHPFSDNRWAEVKRLAENNGWQLGGKTTPLADVFGDDSNE